MYHIKYLTLQEKSPNDLSFKSLHLDKIKPKKGERKKNKDKNNRKKSTKSKVKDLQGFQVQVWRIVYLPDKEG